MKHPKKVKKGGFPSDGVKTDGLIIIDIIYTKFLFPTSR
jgi:hypothetical protein